jgi:hypothetical protein
MNKALVGHLEGKGPLGGSCRLHGKIILKHLKEKGVRKF